MLTHCMDAGLRWAAQDRLSVFAFHAVPRVSPSVPPDLDLKGFEEILDFICEHFQVLPLDHVVQGMCSGRLPSRAACLTFDDGYQSWFDGVVPLLKSRNLHATFYITTGQLTHLPTWHERLAQCLLAMPDPVLSLPALGLAQMDVSDVLSRRRAYELLEGLLKYQPVDVREQLLAQLARMAKTPVLPVTPMSIQQLRELADAGFGIGAHTRTHPILTLCDERSAYEEISQVRETLTELTRVPVHAFAYPNGRPRADYTASHVAMVRKAGYRHAVTTAWGAAAAGDSPFEIPRFTPWGPQRWKMAYQVWRNLRQRPVQLEGQDLSGPTKVMLVENGGGFGGAVVAARSLLEGADPQQVQYDVVSNLPVLPTSGLPSVASTALIPDRVVDTRRMSRLLQSWHLPVLPHKLLSFALGRLDDVTNRLPYFLKLAWHAAKVRPDVVHGNNEPVSNREAMLVAKLLRLPYVQHVRGAIDHVPAGHSLLHSADALVPVSRWLAVDLMLKGVSSHRIRQVYDSIDVVPCQSGAPSAQDLRSQLGLGGHVRLVAMIGMLVPWKGQELFIDAVARLNEPDVAYLIVGGTPERGDHTYAQALRAHVQSLGKQVPLIFTGKLDNLSELMPQMDVVVSCSTAPEPLGLVMLEAMASGCIFVGPAHGAAPEVVEHGVSGFLFEPGQAADLARQLRSALAVGGTPIQSSMRAHAAQAIERFRPVYCADETQRVYLSVQGR